MKDNTGIQYKQALDFVGKLIEYVDDVDAILKDVGHHYGADRAYVFEFSEDRTTVNNTAEWCKEGIEPQIEVLQNIPIDTITVWMDEFKKVGAFYINSLDKDVDENSLTYQILEPQGIDSLIAAPIYNNDEIIGFVGVDNPSENTEDLVVLKVTASIVNSEISKKISQKNLTIKEMTKLQLENNEKLGEIQDIVASANMGIWRIEIVENKDPKMFVDKTMKHLLGIEGQEITPEKTYDDWFYNITPDAVPSVLSSVERMEQGKFDENTYLWKHPTKGVRYVRCGGTAKSIEGGYSLQGYHYDVDEVVRKNQAQMLKLQKALEDKKAYYDTLGALGDVFYSIHVIDLKEDSVVEFSAKNEVKEFIQNGKKNGATLLMKQIMSCLTNDEHKEKALDFTNLSTLPERMKGKQILSTELIGIHIGWFLASFITMEKDESGKPTKVIYTTRVIDEAKKQQEKLIHKTQTDEMTGLLNRRAYEEIIYQQNDIPLEEKFIYVSIDANGLKVINDTKGHAAGDELLIGLSQCMKKSLGPYGQLFRIGGDEFVAILFCDKNEVVNILKDFDETVANWKGKLIDSLTLSYGWIDKYEKPEASTRELGNIAEQRMYEAKSSFYKRQGFDRRGQQDAHKKLCELYTKILKINITEDNFIVVNMDDAEKKADKGYSDKISEWLYSFGKTGQVHPEDLKEYLRLTDLQYIRDYFKSGKTSLHIFYRRKFDDCFKQAMMELVPANDYSEDNMSLFLYVKNIDK